MKFATRRVEVHGYLGLMYRVHPEEARRMLAAEQAEQIDERSIRVSGGLSSSGSIRDDGRASQSSTVTTRKLRMENGGTLLQHKDWHPDLAPLFRPWETCIAR